MYARVYSSPLRKLFHDSILGNPKKFSPLDVGFRKESETSRIQNQNLIFMHVFKITS